MNGTNKNGHASATMSSATRIANGGNGHRLDSWKEIAAYLGRSARCAQRWERNLGLPVHRIRHTEGYTVYAYAAELDAWRESRDRVDAQVEVEIVSGDRAPSPERVAVPAPHGWSDSVFALCRFILRAAPIRSTRS